MDVWCVGHSRDGAKDIHSIKNEDEAQRLAERFPKVIYFFAELT